MQYTKKSVIKKNIPDNDMNGLIDRIIVSHDLIVKHDQVIVNIEHPYIGDISIELYGPNEIRKTILNPSRVTGKDLIRSFSGDLLDVFKGIRSKGEWTIKVVDSGARDNGKLVDWTLDLQLEDSKTTEISVTDVSTVTSNQQCDQVGQIIEMSCDIDIRHSHIGDLLVELVSPSGKSVVLHDKAGSSGDNLIKTYNSNDLKDFIGSTAKGEWSLRINDQMKGDEGRLVEWGVKFITTD